MDNFNRGYNGWTGSGYQYENGRAARQNEERMRREADNARTSADRARFKQAFSEPYVSSYPKTPDFSSRNSTTIYPAGPLGTSTGSSVGGGGKGSSRNGFVLLMLAAAAVFVVWPWLVNVGALAWLAHLAQSWQVDPRYIPLVAYGAQAAIIVGFCLWLSERMRVISVLGAAILLFMHFAH